MREKGGYVAFEGLISPLRLISVFNWTQQLFWKQALDVTSPAWNRTSPVFYKKKKEKSHDRTEDVQLVSRLFLLRENTWTQQTQIWTHTCSLIDFNKLTHMLYPLKEMAPEGVFKTAGWSFTNAFQGNKRWSTARQENNLIFIVLNKK